MKFAWMRWLLCLHLLCGAAMSLSASTWYVRADGGTRYVAAKGEGQCDGKADARYPGHGVNQHCAFSDYRYLYDDRQTYGKMIWAIAGGDTVILDNGKPWRVGFDQGKNASDPWCFGGPGPYGCFNPSLPAGTPDHHTRLLGRNFEHCEAASAKTQLFGGNGVGVVLNLGGAQYVDVQCLEITRHSDCTVHGEPPEPHRCHTNYPLDDYDSEGVLTDVHTHDVLLQDLDIHGHTDRGVQGPIGGVVNANRVRVAMNGSAGWDFDDGHSTPSVNGVWNFSDSLIEWNGCNQEWPYQHPVPVATCYSQSTAGYGDGVGTPANMGLDVHIQHSVFRYNTQDGLDLGHVDTGTHTLSIQNSVAYGNNGGQFKWGPNFTTASFDNNFAVGNCLRLKASMPGVVADFNRHLQDYCRANDAISFNFRQGGTLHFTHNTIVSYAPTTVDIGCWDPSCSASTLVFTNNVLRGYDNPGTYTLGGQHGGPGAFYLQKPIGHIQRSGNDFFGMRGECPAIARDGEHCADPGLSNAPHSFTSEAALDGVSAVSAMHGAGANPEALPKL